MMKVQHQLPCAELVLWHVLFCSYRVTIAIRCQKPSWGLSQHLVPCSTQFLVNVHTSE